MNNSKTFDAQIFPNYWTFCSTVIATSFQELEAIYTSMKVQCATWEMKLLYLQAKFITFFLIPQRKINDKLFLPQLWLLLLLLWYWGFVSSTNQLFWEWLCSLKMSLSERTDWGCHQWTQTHWSNKSLNYVHNLQLSNILSPHKDCSVGYSRRSLPFLIYMLKQQWTIVVLSRWQCLPKPLMDLNYLSNISNLDKGFLSVRLVWICCQIIWESFPLEQRSWYVCVHSTHF